MDSSLFSATSPVDNSENLSRCINGKSHNYSEFKSLLGNVNFRCTTCNMTSNAPLTGGSMGYADQLRKELNELLASLPNMTGGARSDGNESENSQSSDPLAKYREFVAFIRQDMGMKGGPISNMFAGYFRKLAKEENPGASQDELHDTAIRIYQEEKEAGRLNEILDRIKEKFAKRKAERKNQGQSQNTRSRSRKL